MWVKYKNTNIELDDPEVLSGKILGKRVRLVEDQISYEQLYSPLNVFSEDENTVSSYRSRRKENADKRELKEVKDLLKKFRAMKIMYTQGMDLILKTVYSIDESSQKIMLGLFD